VAFALHGRCFGELCICYNTGWKLGVVWEGVIAKLMRSMLSRKCEIYIAFE